MLDLNRLKYNPLVKFPKMGGIEAEYQNMIRQLINEVERCKELLVEVASSECEFYGDHCVTHKCRLPCPHVAARDYLSETDNV